MRKQTNYKLPEELIAALQEKALVERTSATDLVIQALNNFLDVNPEKEGARIVYSIPELGSEIEKIKQRLDEIEASKQLHFMSNSPHWESNAIDIRIDSDTTSDNDSVKNITVLTSKLKELGDENKDLRERVKALEALIPEYNCQEFIRHQVGLRGRLYSPSTQLDAVLDYLVRQSGDS
jgi:predicted  nucleic acid-binding Zn-ribbon protein